MRATSREVRGYKGSRVQGFGFPTGTLGHQNPRTLFF
jgi:hypothetical protein